MFTKHSIYRNLPLWKTAMSLSLAMLGLLLASPLLVLAVLALKLESPHAPLFYAAIRAGYRFRRFPLFKFRTMIVDADQHLHTLVNTYHSASHSVDKLKANFSTSPLLIGPGGEPIAEADHLYKQAQCTTFFKSTDDPRITPVRKFLRKTSIDELPQLFNVLKGEMAIVGLRPLPLYEAEKLTQDQDVLRFSAVPGITGLWQSEKLFDPHINEERRKAMDLEYAQAGHSFVLDSKIILRTVWGMLTFKNA